MQSYGFFFMRKLEEVAESKELYFLERKLLIKESVFLPVK